MIAKTDYTEKLKSGDYYLEIGPNCIGKKQEQKLRKLKPYEKCGIYRGLCYYMSRFDMACYLKAHMMWLSLVLSGDNKANEKYKAKISELKKIIGEHLLKISRAAYEKKLNREEVFK